LGHTHLRCLWKERFNSFMALLQRGQIMGQWVSLRKSDSKNSTRPIRVDMRDMTV